MRIARVDVDDEVRYCEPDGERLRLLNGNLRDGLERDTRAISPERGRELSPVTPGKILVILGGFPRGMSLEEARRIPPRFASKLPSTVVANGDAVVVPDEIGPAVTLEPELAVVMGARARRCSPEEALSAVLGFTCFNDITHLPFIREERDFLRAKSIDTFGPLGPWIETELTEADVVAGLQIRATINGDLVHSGNTADFTHRVGEVVSEASRYFTLEPEDVISLGTPLDPVTASIGDTISIEVEGIGTLVNHVVGER